MMLRRSSRPAPRDGPRLGLIVFAVATVVAISLWFALRGPDSRAGAVVGALAAIASTTAALTALHLSRNALARTDQQLAHARLVTVLSRHPLLLPVHQSVAFPDSSGALAAHLPTQDRFKLIPPPVGTYAFVADTPGTFLVPIENAGEGPALNVVGTLWHQDGTRGLLAGPTTVGAGKTAVYRAALSEQAEPLPDGFAKALAAAGEAGTIGCFWLETQYSDLFANAVATTAYFDPRGLGGWKTISVGLPVWGPKLDECSTQLYS